MKQTNYFSANLKKLAETYSQKKLAEDTKVSPASINNYINKDSEPSIYFLIGLKNAYGINIDDFLFKPLENQTFTETLPEGYERFVGNYMIYHYETSSYKGSVSTYAQNTLDYGIVSLYVNSSNELVASAIFSSSRVEAENLLESVDKLKNYEDIEKFYNKRGKAKYVGKFSFSESQLFLLLENHEKNDMTLLIFNNPPSIRNYIGGIGTVNTISRGREQMPCIQFVLLSREKLLIPDGEIYNLLALDAPDIDLSVESEQLIKLFKTLYSDNDFANNLTDENKKRVIEDSLSSILSEAFEANNFRFAKISGLDDDKYYRIIKRSTHVR